MQYATVLVRTGGNFAISVPKEKCQCQPTNKMDSISRRKAPKFRAGERQLWEQDSAGAHS